MPDNDKWAVVRISRHALCKLNKLAEKHGWKAPTELEDLICQQYAIEFDVPIKVGEVQQAITNTICPP